VGKPTVVERVEPITATIKNAPQLVLAEISSRHTGSSFLDLLRKTLERILCDYLNLEGRRAHMLFNYPLILEQFQNMWILYFLALSQQPHVLIHLLLDMEGQNSQL